MARKTKEETEITRRRILDIALEVFDERGFARTSLQEIASRAGFTRGAVYWHFKNKAELFMAIADEVEADSYDLFGDPDRVQTREELCRALIDYLVRLETDDRVGTYYRVAYFRMEWSEELAPVFERYRRETKELADWIVDALRNLTDRGQVEVSRNPRSDGLALLALFMGIITVWVTDPSLISLQDEASQLIGDLIEGFRT